MNRDKFEKYCLEHDWTVEGLEGQIVVSKGKESFKEHLHVGMRLGELVDKMKHADYGKDEVQGKFPFTKSDELQM